MTPRPARRRAPGRNVDPACVTDTDFWLASMAQMHRDHARVVTGLAAVAGARGLAFHQLLGEVNQHLLRAMIAQPAKRPEQPQLQQR